MRVITNKKLVQRNKQIATWLFLGTLAVLIGGFVLVNYSLFTGNTPSELVLVGQVVALPLVFVLTIFSVRMTNMWARDPRPDKAIEEGLKGISKKSVLYNYYHSPVRHILIAPQGIFAIVTRWHNGKFTVENDKWRSHRSSISKFFSAMRMDGVGRPDVEAENAVKQVKSMFEDIDPDLDVKPLIVFVNPDVEIEFEGDNSLEILYTNEKKSPNLSEYMRELNRLQKDDLQKKAVLPLTEEQIEAFENATIKK